MLSGLLFKSRGLGAVALRGAAAATVAATAAVTVKGSHELLFEKIKVETVRDYDKICARVADDVRCSIRSVLGLGAVPKMFSQTTAASDQNDDVELPTISLEELRKHRSEESLWVAYGGKVYDVTSFLKHHPGGADPLLGAGGQDLEAFWNLYPIHYQNKSAQVGGQSVNYMIGGEKLKMNESSTSAAMDVLAATCIGKLTEVDAEKLRDASDPENAAAKAASESDALQTAKRRRTRRMLSVVLVAATLPFWTLSRWLIRLLGFVFGQRVANVIVGMLPVSVPGYSGREPLDFDANVTVAIIGGGISGCTCAYSLSKSGCNVVVYEARHRLGGNAQTATFPHPSRSSGTIRQDLSVLYWAPEFYRNYGALLDDLGVKPATVSLPYVLCVRENSGEKLYYTPPGTPMHAKVCSPIFQKDGLYGRDFERYDAMCSTVRSVNRFFCWGDARTSFYKHCNWFSMVNPFNFMSISLCCKLFGISNGFYNKILKPFHGFQFTTRHIGSIPAVSLGALDDICPLTSSRKHRSWGAGNSVEVFDKLAEHFEARMDTRVWKVERLPSGKLKVADDRGSEDVYDRVVFACPAHAAFNILRPSGFYEEALLRGVKYHDDFVRADWKDWLESPAHCDENCLPDDAKRNIFMNEAAFFVDVALDKTSGEVENVEYTHILGSWSPAAAKSGASGMAMFLSQSIHPSEDDRIDFRKVVATFSAPRAHPDMCFSNLMITQLLHLIQGRNGCFFISNYAAPGNGHDLSCTAGLAAASALGAHYPFENAEAKKDHDLMRSFMGI